MKRWAVFILLLGFCWGRAVHAAGDGAQVFLHVYNCNENHICEPELGETYLGCPLDDCPAPTSTASTSTFSQTYVAPLTGVSSSDFHLPNEIVPGSLIITVTEHSANISWETYGESLGIISWGRTTENELGSISEINFGKTHQVFLDNLNAGTLYFFTIESRDLNGNSIFIQNRKFFTSSGNLLPYNPSNFHFVLVNDGALLLWTNPTDKNFEEVRLLRSNNFFPATPNDGQILYEGPGNSFLDTNVTSGGNYYYTLFAKNKNGAYSSGAILHLKIQNSGGEHRSPPASQLHFSDADFNIEQGNKSIFLYENKAVIEKITPFTFSYLNASDNNDFQFIILSLEDENTAGTYNSYLLNKNEESNAYEANIPAYQKEGEYHFYASGLDALGNDLARYDGTLTVKSPAPSLIPTFLVKIMAYLKAFWQWIYIHIIVPLFH